MEPARSEPAYALIIGGWVLATALVAGITRVLVRG